MRDALANARIAARYLLHAEQARWCGHCGDRIGRALWLRSQGAGGSLAHRWALLGAVAALGIAQLWGVGEDTAERLEDMIDWAMSPYDPPTEKGSDRC